MKERGSETAPAVAVVTLSSFLAPFMASALNVALPAIGKRFAMGAVSMSWVVTAYVLAAAVFLLPFGRAADIYGRKKIFLWGMIVYTFGSLLSAVALSPGVLIAARVINGAGAAMSFATGTAILMSVVSMRKRGSVLGWNVAAVYMGLSVGPFLGGIITHDLGWRWIFILNAAVGMAAAIFTAWKLKGEWANAGGERLDAAGSVIYAATLVALMCGFSWLPGSRGAMLLLAAALGAVLFVRRELRCTNPVFDFRAFAGNPVFTFSNLAALINYSATAAVTFLLSLYLQYEKGFTPQQAGLVLVVQPILMAVFSPLAGRLSDRTDAGRLASAGMLLTVVGLVIFCFLRPGTNLAVVVTGLAVLGLGFALFSSPNTNAVMSSVDPRYYGIASGVLSTMRLIGQMLSMGIVMFLLALFLGGAPITPALYPLFMKAFKLSFAVCVALCVLGIFASLARGRTAAADPLGDGEPPHC